MKQVFFILLLLPLISLSQLTDTTCIKSRWISLKPNEINKNLFLLDSMYDENIDLVFVIKKLVESQKLNIYTQNNGVNGTRGWYYIPYNKEMEESLKDSLSYWNNDPYFQISVQPDYPLIDEYGDPRIHTNSDGSQSYMYPPADIYVFPSNESDEIRIKEDRIYNERTYQYEFVPVGLSFYFKGSKYSRGQEKFWVDLNELFNSLENKTNFPWYKTIINRKYEGFQYMQVSCYDDEIKN